MAARTARALALAAAFAAMAGAALAQPLGRLTVASFTLTADTVHPRIDAPFHLIVTLRIREHLSAIGNLNLPMLADLELLGDERQTTSGVGGTQYRETITVVARQSGAIAIAPATLQAIDARDGKAKQWYSNALSINVGGAPPLAREGAELLGLLRTAFRVVLLVMVVGAVVAILVIVLSRRPQRVAAFPAPPPQPPPPLVVRSERQRLEDALTVLRAERTRRAALAVRNAVWRMLGADGGATLADVLRRRESGDPTMRDLLVALERSAFTYDEDLHNAIEDACAALERSIESLA